MGSGVDSSVGVKIVGHSMVDRVVVSAESFDRIFDFWDCVGKQVDVV